MHPGFEFVGLLISWPVNSMRKLFVVILQITISTSVGAHSWLGEDNFDDSFCFPLMIIARVSIPQRTFRQARPWEMIDCLKYW